MTINRMEGPNRRLRESTGDNFPTASNYYFRINIYCQFGGRCNACFCFLTDTQKLSFVKNLYLLRVS